MAEIFAYDATNLRWVRCRADATGRLIVTTEAAAPLAVDVTDRWARALGQVDVARVLGVALSAVNPLIAGIFDAAGNRMPAGDIPARAIQADVIDRAVRLAGIIYGDQGQLAQRPLTGDVYAQLRAAGVEIDPRDVTDRATRILGVTYGSQAQQIQQKAATFELLTEDTGLNTNPERWLHDNHWDCDGVTIAVAGAGGQQNLGAAVGAGLTRRIKEITIRHAGTNATVVTLLVGVTVRLTIDVPAGTTRVWSSQDGRLFTAGQQPVIQTSDVVGGSTFVSASGVEA